MGIIWEVDSALDPSMLQELVILPVPPFIKTGWCRSKVELLQNLMCFEIFGMDPGREQQQ